MGLQLRIHNLKLLFQESPPTVRLGGAGASSSDDEDSKEGLSRAGAGGRARVIESVSVSFRCILLAI